MESHQYNFDAGDLLKLAGLPLLFLLLLVLALHAARGTGMLASPRPIFDVDRTILLHQAAAANNGSSAEIVLIGDSSCLMDAQADQLGAGLGKTTLNLGTLSYLDLTAYALLLRDYSAHHPSPKTVVLLMHPEALRLSGGNDYFNEVLTAWRAGTDLCDPRSSKPVCWLGADIVKGRVLSRLIPFPLPASYGRDYGFNWDLWNFISQHDGSAFDPHRFDAATAHGNPEYRLAKNLKEKSRAFRKSLPPGTRLLVAITPSPRGYVLPGHDQQCEKMLQEWSAWLGADGALKSLPFSMPDDLFASTTHLNQSGAKRFTELLAASLGNPPSDRPSRTGR
jgi:hypothetical protein